MKKSIIIVVCTILLIPSAFAGNSKTYNNEIFTGFGLQLFDNISPAVSVHYGYKRVVAERCLASFQLELIGLNRAEKESVAISINTGFAGTIIDKKFRLYLGAELGFYASADEIKQKVGLYYNDFETYNYYDYGIILRPFIELARNFFSRLKIDISLGYNFCYHLGSALAISDRDQNTEISSDSVVLPRPKGINASVCLSFIF